MLSPPETLVERNARRLTPPELRPGHHVMPAEELLEAIIFGMWDPLDVPSEIIRVDTSGAYDYADILRRIRQAAPQLTGKVN